MTSLRTKFLKKNTEEGMTLHVPEFGDFSLEEQPGGTLKGNHPTKDGKFEKVCLLYEKRPTLIRFKLQRSEDPEGKRPLGDAEVKFTYNRKDERWHFDKWSGSLGKNVAPMEWDAMLNGFLSEKHPRKWLEEEENFGLPKKSIFQRLMSS